MRLFRCVGSLVIIRAEERDGVLRPSPKAEVVGHSLQRIEGTSRIGPHVGRLGLPAPGSSMATGVSSACSTLAERTKRFCATNSGSSAAPPPPDQLASVERGVCTPERALMAS